MRCPRSLRFALAIAVAAGLAACEEVAPDRTAGQKLDAAIDSTRHSVSDAGARVEARAQDAVVVIKDARDAVGQQAADASVALNDAAITASIKADFLKDDGLDVLKIEVDSRDGVVSLNGLAGSDASRLRAGRIAAAIKGVHEVRNFLVVKQA